MSVVHTERVLVVPTADFHQLGYFQGISTEVDRYLAELLTPDRVSYRPRGELEEDPNFKQLIPYVIFRHTDEDGQVRLFQYTRGAGQGEKRLQREREHAEQMKQQQANTREQLRQLRLQLKR